MLAASIDLSFLPPFWTAIVMNGIGVYAGFYAITTIEGMKISLTGKVVSTMTFFQYGMLLLTCSFGFTLLFTALGFLPAGPVSIYEIFMMGGTISFAFFASSFARIVITAN